MLVFNIYNLALYNIKWVASWLRCEMPLRKWIKFCHFATFLKVTFGQFDVLLILVTATQHVETTQQLCNGPFSGVDLIFLNYWWAIKVPHTRVSIYTGWLGLLWTFYEAWILNVQTRSCNFLLLCCVTSMLGSLMTSYNFHCSIISCVYHLWSGISTK